MISFMMNLLVTTVVAQDQCAEFSHAGIDYADPNITVLSGDPASNPGSCCEACALYNTNNASATATCALGVWHNIRPPLCVLKASSVKPIKGHLVVAWKPPAPKPAFRFSSTHSSGMVLQSAPAQSSVWGVCPDGDSVTVSFNGSDHAATIEIVHDLSVWTVQLPPVEPGFTTYTIEARSRKVEGSAGRIAIDNVVFGDVWVCSGQSNMAYSLNGSNGREIVHPPVNNSQVEIEAMHQYPFIRLFRPGEAQSSTPTLETFPTDFGGSVPAVQGWSEPCPKVLGGRCRVDFSNVCWFYGRDIFRALTPKRPIGLIGTYVGGTPDEKWSSPDALVRCGVQPSKAYSVLWNAMVSPLTRSTIKGAVWYQGEADAHHPGGKVDGYNCTFPAMISDWRAKWNKGTRGETGTFPFGFVQLNSVGNDTVYDDPEDPSAGDPYSTQFGYGGIRWAQSAGYGYAPNPKMRKVFMAVSLDTPDVPYPNGPHDPHGFNVHSPFKQPTASRLARAGLAVAYGQKEIGTYAPFWEVAQKPGSDKYVTLRVTNVTEGTLIVHKAIKGFEALVKTARQSWRWVNVPISSFSGLDVTLGPMPEQAVKVRYNWYSKPCGNFCFSCAVYVNVKPIGSESGELSFLPLPPFIAKV